MGPDHVELSDIGPMEFVKQSASIKAVCMYVYLKFNVNEVTFDCTCFSAGKREREREGGREGRRSPACPQFIKANMCFTAQST